MGPFIQQMQRNCSSCNGQGSIINDINQCKYCYGKKILQEYKTLEIVIAHGSENGEVIKYSGQANQIVILFVFFSLA
jgi:DnaJ family protein A protein 2